MSDPVQKLLTDLQEDLEALGWPTPLQFARAIGLSVLDGPVASLNIGPPPVVQLPSRLRGFRRGHTLAHECAHALLIWREIDAELLAYYAPECAYNNLEALSNHMAGMIAIPQPLLDRILRETQFSPQTILALSRETGAPLDVAMARVVYETDRYNRAALLFKRGLLLDFASTMWLEVERYDRIAAPADYFPGIQLATVSTERRMVLGTWGA